MVPRHLVEVARQSLTRAEKEVGRLRERLTRSVPKAQWDAREEEMIRLTKEVSYAYPILHI